MRRAKLHSRIAKLERKTQTSRWPRICSATYDFADEDVIGVESWIDGVSVQIARQPGETLQALAARAFERWEAVLNIAALYAPRDCLASPNGEVPLRGP